MLPVRRQERTPRPPRAPALVPAAVTALGLLAAVLAGALPTGAEGAPAPGSRLVADRGVDRIVDGERVSYLYGHVFIDRDTVTAAADTGIVYRDQERYELYGRVRLTDHGTVLTCRRAVYERLPGRGDFFGDVHLVDGDVVGTGLRGESREGGRLMRLIGDALLVTPDYTVRADTVERDRVTGVGEAFGHVQILEPGAKNLVTGDHAVFVQADDVATVDRNPVLTSREQSGGPLTSTAGLMRFFRAEDKVVMTDSVRIRQGDTRAAADTAVAYGRERMVLTGSPRVGMGGKSTMYGDRIEFLYRARRLHRVILTGDARMEDASPDSLAKIYEGLPDLDVLTGDSISVEFADDKIRRTVVVGHATSRYTPLDLGDEVATNDVAGDTIVIHFRNERVRQVDVQGNMSGTYRFARVAAMREMLGRSRRLADLLAGVGADTVRADSLAAAGDLAAAALEDSLVRAEIDSLARSIGLVPPAAAGAVEPGLVDSLLTAALDSLAAAGLDTSRSGLDFLANAQDVKYSGGQVTFEMRDKTIDIRRDGTLEYGTMNLTADHIKLDTRERELYAEGEPLVKDAETIAGDRMGYNFRYKSAAVEDGVTSFDNYYYVGDEIRRFEDTTLKIHGGKMTSCDLAEPHYHFWADKMKMRMGDKVVAAPIVLRIGHVPVFALPFYYKSLKTGRQSGILFPNFDFGWSSREGRYIRDFGYYWATNDYMDFTFQGSYNEHQDLGWRISNAYRKRYAFQGNVDYTRKDGLGDNPRREWQLRWNHNQPNLFDDYQFRADVRLASTTLSSNDLTSSVNRDIVSGQLKSSVYVSRNWSFMNGSLNAVRDERTNAADEDPATDQLIYTQTLPSLSLGFRQFTLLPQRSGGGKGSLPGDILRNTYFSQSYSMNAGRTGYEERNIRNYQAQGSWSLTMRPPRLGIFNVSGSANAGQSWKRQEVSGRTYHPAVVEDDTLVVVPAYWTPLGEITEQTSPSLSFGANLGTTLYGLFPVRVGALRAIRHTLKFTTGWSVRPALRGRQDFGTSYTFSLGNRLDVKYATGGKDSTETTRKLDGLVDWDLNTSYNPKAAADRRWSDIRSSLQIRPGQANYLKLRVTNTIDPRNLALKSTNFTYGLNFSGRLDTGAGSGAAEPERNSAIDRLGLEPAEADTAAGDGYGPPRGLDPQDPFANENDPDSDYARQRGRLGAGGQRKDPTDGGRYLPFDVGFNMSYSYNNTVLTNRQRTQASVNIRANLTRDWDLRYTASFDLVAGTPTRQQYSLHRDLHCWSLEFTRTISEVDSSFGFRLYLLSIPDLKFARGREGAMGGLSSGLGW